MALFSARRGVSGPTKLAFALVVLAGLAAWQFPDYRTLAIAIAAVVACLWLVVTLLKLSGRKKRRTQDDETDENFAEAFGDDFQIDDLEDIDALTETSVPEAAREEITTVEAALEARQKSPAPEPQVLVGLLQRQRLAGFWAQTLHRPAPKALTSKRERYESALVAQVRCPLNRFVPVEGTLPRGRMLRWSFLSGRGGVGKSTAAALAAGKYSQINMERVLLLDVNVKGRLETAMEVEGRPHHKTIVDLAKACILGQITCLADFEEYCIRTDTGVLMASRHNIKQKPLSHKGLMAILKVAEKYFNLVVFDGGNDDSGVMDTVIKESDVCCVVIDPALEEFKLALTDAANIMLKYPTKPIAIVANQRHAASNDQLETTIREFRRPDKSREDRIRWAFWKFHRGGLHVRILPHMPAFVNDGMLWTGNAPEEAHWPLVELLAMLIRLSFGLGDDTPQRPPGQFSKEKHPTGPASLHAQDAGGKKPSKRFGRKTTADAAPATPEVPQGKSDADQQFAPPPDINQRRKETADTQTDMTKPETKVNGKEVHVPQDAHPAANGAAQSATPQAPPAPPTPPQATVQAPPPAAPASPPPPVAGTTPEPPRRSRIGIGRRSKVVEEPDFDAPLVSGTLFEIAQWHLIQIGYEPVWKDTITEHAERIKRLHSDIIPDDLPADAVIMVADLSLEVAREEAMEPAGY